MTVLDLIARAVEKVRVLESNKEQRYLLRVASDALRAAEKPVKEIAASEAAGNQGSSPAKRPRSTTSVGGGSPTPSASNRSSLQTKNDGEMDPPTTSQAPPPPASTEVTVAPSSSTFATSDANKQSDACGANASPVSNTVTLNANVLDGDDVNHAINIAATVVRLYAQFCLQHNRTNIKLLEALMELCHQILALGLIPIDAEWCVPTQQLTVPSHVTASVFSKVLGMMRPAASSVTAPPPPPAAATAATVTTAATGGSVATAATPPTTPPTALSSASVESPKAAESVRTFEALALSSLAVAQIIPLTESAAISATCAVVAAVAPDVVRVLFPLTGDRSPRTGLSSSALHRHAYWLLVVATRAQLPSLAPYAKTGLATIVTAMSKELERLHAAGSGDNGSSGSRGAIDAQQHLLHRDVVTVMKLCLDLTSSSEGGIDNDSLSSTPAATSSAKGGAVADAGCGSPLTAYAATAPLQPLKSMDCKVTCLSLILQFIVNGGPAFRKSHTVLRFVKTVLFPTVLQSALSSEIDVYRLSLNILLSLYNFFHAELVVECGTFFQHVIFQVWTSQNTSILQKQLALEVVKNIAEEPKNLLNMYLNYDCDPQSNNIYETLLLHLDTFTNAPQVRASRVRRSQQQPAATASPAVVGTTTSGGTTAAGGSGTPSAANPLQALALSTLLCIADSNLQWIDRFEIDHQQTERSTAPGTSSATASGTAAEDRSSASAQTDTAAAAAAGAANVVADNAASLVTFIPAVSTDSNANQFLVAKRKKMQLETFLRMFNMDQTPEKAIQFLQTTDLLPSETDVMQTTSPLRKPPQRSDLGIANASFSSDEDGATAAASPQSLTAEERHTEDLLSLRTATFLYGLDGSLDRLVLGDFFSKSFRKETNRRIFKYWIESHNFRDLLLDEALRMFLGGFKLLGEAQIVDNTMELFAAHYCRLNPTAFSSANTAFVLSFSCCMLNTDSHSAHVTEKMTKDGFIRNNRGVDDGKDVDSDILSGIYDRITHTEIKLRPLKSGIVTANAIAQKTKKPQSSSAVAVLESIPLLRHLVPIAETIGDTVMIPMDAAGNMLFNTAQRKRTEQYYTEFHEVLREAMSLLRERAGDESSHGSGNQAGGPTPSFVQASSVEHAIPMWDLTVDIIVDGLEHALQDLCQFDDSSTASSSSSGGEGSHTTSQLPASPSVPTSSFAGVLDSDTEAIFDGVVKTLKVCASFGSIGQAERLIQKLYTLSMFPSVLSMRRTSSSQLGCEVIVRKRIPANSLRCVVAILEAFAAVGSAFTASMWTSAYQLVSYLDALAQYVRRGTAHHHHHHHTHTKSQQSGGKEGQTPPEAVPNTKRRGWFFFGSATSSTDDPVTPQSNMQTNAVGDQTPSPSSAPVLSENSIALLVVRDMQRICNMELWVERLYDATSYSSQSLLQMINGLCTVCLKELDVGRVFSLSRLTEFCTVCTSVATRMQWRDLWNNAEPVFVAAGCKDTSIALHAVDGLKGIAYHYLLKPELAMYRFQKDLLRPFERILMCNASLSVRVAAQRAAYDMIENRSDQLASGWSVILSLLSHGALLPELVDMSWSCCELLLTKHLECLTECFSDLIFCLTSFAANGIREHIAHLGASYLVACGSWLQVGLQPLPLISATPFQAATVFAPPPPPHIWLIEASRRLLDPPALKELDDISDMTALHGLCENGGKYLGIDMTSLGLTSEDWLTCGGMDDDATIDERNKSPDDRMVLTKQLIRATVRRRRESTEAVMRFSNTFEPSFDSPDRLNQNRNDEDEADQQWSTTAGVTEDGLSSSTRATHPSPSVRSPAVLRVSLSPTPLSASRKLARPSGYGLRTEYHLWSSLFDGMVPIVIAHASPRVRLHAICCVLELIRRFGKFFEQDLQDSLLAPLLRSAINAVSTDEALLVAKDPMYELIVRTTIRGMFYACAVDSHLMSMACHSLKRVATQCKQPMCITGGLVQMILDTIRAMVLETSSDAIGPPRRDASSGSSEAPSSPSVSQFMARNIASVMSCGFDELLDVTRIASEFPSTVVQADAERSICRVLHTTLVPAIIAAWEQICTAQDAGPNNTTASTRENHDVSNSGIAATLPMAASIQQTLLLMADVCASYERCVRAGVHVSAPQRIAAVAVSLEDRNDMWSSALAESIQTLCSDDVPLLTSPSCHTVSELTMTISSPARGSAAARWPNSASALTCSALKRTVVAPCVQYYVNAIMRKDHTEDVVASTSFCDSVLMDVMTKYVNDIIVKDVLVNSARLRWKVCDDWVRRASLLNLHATLSEHSSSTSGAVGREAIKDSATLRASVDYFSAVAVLNFLLLSHPFTDRNLSFTGVLSPSTLIAAFGSPVSAQPNPDAELCVSTPSERNHLTGASCTKAKQHQTAAAQMPSSSSAAATLLTTSNIMICLTLVPSRAEATHACELLRSIEEHVLQLPLDPVSVELDDGASREGDTINDGISSSSLIVQRLVSLLQGRTLDQGKQT